jgi:uncharacterized protein YkwD
MNPVDVFLVIIILFSLWSGWEKGFISGLFDLVMLLGSLAAAFVFYPYLVILMNRYIKPPGTWTTPLAFLFTLIVARLIIGMLVREISKSIPTETLNHPFNRFFGLVPGFINGIFNAVIVSALLLAIPFSDGLSATTRESKIADRLTEPAEWMESKLSPVFSEAVSKSMNKLTVEPNSIEKVELPFKVEHPRVRSDLEEKMLILVNEERQKEGLKPLEADPELTEVARSHSTDMFARSYFAHVNPDNKDPFDRMRSAGVRFLTAGENLALAQTLKIAHNGLMNSPGHRANILKPTFGRVGIGIMDGGIYGLMISQEFRN